MSLMHPPEPTKGRLHDVWNLPVKDLVLMPAPQLLPEQVERHQLYCLLLMALLAHYWNGNKRGKDGTYPWREKQKRPDGQYQGGDYLGHNIACIAVDAEGDIIDFDFNHNEVLSSSVEHAEARLIRRVFSLTQINNGWATHDVSSAAPPIAYSTLLSDVTVYTSLESCSQCSGIMALGSVKEVVFLQRDPGQSSIGNILRMLGPISGSYRPPLPIPADLLGFSYFGQLDTAFAQFEKGVPNQPFFVPQTGKPDRSPSITSFLCTDLAMDIFNAGRDHFSQLANVNYPNFKPKRDNGAEIPKALSNQEVLVQAKRFLTYASSAGRRGTPHKL